MKYLILSTIFLIILMPSNIYAGNQCRVVDISLYSNTSGYVDPNEGGYVDTSRCAVITIQNTSDGLRYACDYKLTALFGNGTTRTRKVQGGLTRIPSGATYTTSQCFGSGSSQVIGMDCNF